MDLLCLYLIGIYIKNHTKLSKFLVNSLMKTWNELSPNGQEGYLWIKKLILSLHLNIYLYGKSKQTCVKVKKKKNANIYFSPVKLK